MKVDTRYNSRNYAGAYYARAKKKTGNASAPLLRLCEVVYEETETREAKGGRQEVMEPGDVNGSDNQRRLHPFSPSLSLSLLLYLSFFHSFSQFQEITRDKFFAYRGDTSANHCFSFREFESER